MIVPKEELKKYLGKKLDDLGDKIDNKTLEKLRFFDNNTNRNFDLSIIDYIFLEHQREKSIVDLSKEFDIDYSILTRIFDFYKLPRLNGNEAIKRKWSNPKYREEMSNRSRELMHKNLLDPKFREKASNGARESINLRRKDPGFRIKQIEGLKRSWQDLERRKRHSELFKRKWQDEEFRTRQSEGLRKKLDDPAYRAKISYITKNRWQDPSYREKVEEGIKRNWGDPYFRKRNAEGKRRAKLDPKNLSRYKLPTITGYRNDIGFYAQSIWEANLARIFLYCGREFYTRGHFKLNVTEKYKHLFKDKITETNIDFIVQDSRGNLNLYEIVVGVYMSHEAKKAKLEMIIEQYPDLGIHIIDGPSYYRLEKWFKDKINSNPRLNGWETRKDNLKTNPKKYK